jgi:hypothetical protein
VEVVPGAVKNGLRQVILGVVQLLNFGEVIRVWYDHQTRSQTALGQFQVERTAVIFDVFRRVVFRVDNVNSHVLRNLVQLIPELLFSSRAVFFCFLSEK